VINNARVAVLAGSTSWVFEGHVLVQVSKVPQLRQAARRTIQAPTRHVLQTADDRSKAPKPTSPAKAAVKLVSSPGTYRR
jgi:hypothetical protein